MTLLQAHEQSKKYFSDDFIEGFNLGAKAQYSRDKEEKTGHWENVDIIHDRKDAKITDWQQAQCSVCGKWQTKPYLYGINLDPYCPSCGARMVNENE